MTMIGNVSRNLGKVAVGDIRGMLYTTLMIGSCMCGDWLLLGLLHWWTGDRLLHVVLGFTNGLVAWGSYTLATASSAHMYFHIFVLFIFRED